MEQTSEATKQKTGAGAVDKAAIKNEIKALKADRDKALGAKDGKELKKVRRKIHDLKHRLRSATD